MKNVYRTILDTFSAPVVPLDCGEKCRHLNDGIPVCCDVGHAVPIMSKSEFKVLRSRSDLWRKYKPKTADGKEVVSDLADSCVACECKGAMFCERDNRSLSCRAFPFFPYTDKKGRLLGLAPYWTFEDRCWVISHMSKVTKAYVKEFFETYERLFAADPEEHQVFRDYSATMRRVFSKKKRPIFIIDRDRNFIKIKPHGKGQEPVKKDKLPAFDPFR